MTITTLSESSTDFSISSDILTSVMEDYADDLNDDSSSIYTLFSSMLYSEDIDDDAEYILVYEFIYGLYYSLFTPTEVLDYYDNNSLSTDIDSFAYFYASLESEQTTLLDKKANLYNALRSKFLNINGTDYNFYSEISSAINNPEYDILSASTLSYVLPSTQWLVTPNISYMNATNNESFRSVVEAEKEYQTELQEFADSRTADNNYLGFFSYNDSDTLTSSTSEVYDSALLNLSYKKSSYFQDTDDNDFFVSIMKQEYYKINSKDLYDIIDEIVDDTISIVDLYNISADEEVLYSEIDNTYFATAFIAKMAEIEEIDTPDSRDDFCYIKASEIFRGLFDFADSYTNTLATSAYETFRENVISFREKLLENAWYTEGGIW